MDDDLQKVLDRPDDQPDTSYIQEIGDFLDASGISQAELARRSGVSTAVLSALRHGSYEGRVDENVKKVKAIIEQERERIRSMLKKPSFVETSVSKTILNTLSLARIDGSMPLITGESGLGKTFALEHFKNRYPATILVEVYEGINVLAKIADQLDLDSRGRKEKIFDAIIEKLLMNQRMIVIDEADYLRIKSIDTLRRIYDLAKVPVALVGLPEILRKLQAERSEYKQIVRRITPISLPKLARTDITSIITTVIDNPTDAVIDTFCQLTKNNAGLLEKLILLSQRTAIRNEENITVPVIKAAAEHMIL